MFVHRKFQKVLLNFGSNLIVPICASILYLISLEIGFNDAVMLHEDVSEDPCLDPEPNAIRPNLDFLLTLARHSAAPYFIPLGSQHFYRRYAQYLLGRPAENQEELDRMNLRIQGSLTHTWITTGYNQRFIQQCIPALAFFKSFCIAGLGSEETNLSPTRRTMNTLVWTNNQTAALFTRCTNGIENDWFVLSVVPNLERATMKNILKEVIKLGYNASLAARARY